jgi:DNA-binding beta-propeller fold protein YncE
LTKTVSVPGDGGWDYLTVDAAGRRVYVSHSTQVEVLDADSGLVVGKIADTAGDRVDAGAFDPKKKLVFCSCGDGTVTVIRQETPDTYAVVETIKTRTGSRTMALDPQTHRLFLPGAEYEPAGAAAGARGRPAMVPGSYVVLVFDL